MDIINDYNLISTIDAVVAKQAEIYALPSDVVENVLQTNDWNTDALTTLEFADNAATVPAITPITYCEICQDNENVQGAKLACGHTFCSDCITGQIKAAIDDGPTCIRIPCLSYKCATTIPRSLISSCLNSACETNYYNKYCGHIIRDFITKCGKKGLGLGQFRLVYCINPSCNKVARIPYGCMVDEIACPCGTSTCAQCGNEYHAPCGCSDLKRWTARCNNDGDTAKWLMINTKQCPKCKVNIEKNQGCNHMTCRKCKHEFCWICFANWSGHNYQCTKAPKESDELISTKTEMAYYAKIYTSFQDHSNALKYALGLPTYKESDNLYLASAKTAIVNARRFCKYVNIVTYYYNEKFGPIFKEYFQHIANLCDTLQDYVEHKDSMLDDFTLEGFNDYQKRVIINTNELSQNCIICHKMLEQIMDADDTAATLTAAAQTPSYDISIDDDIANYDIYSDYEDEDDTTSEDDDTI